jgi:glycosyltransferase involved in cell wall biosynthesis
MKIALITDAWQPQVNGVVITLVELVRGLRERGHEVLIIEPGGFKRFPCPGYAEIELAWRPYRQVAAQLAAFEPDAVHIATEGPLGGAARKFCLRQRWAFSTAFHTRFPDILARALHIPTRWGYALFRRFHAPSSSVMVPTVGMRRILQEHGLQNLRDWSHGVDLGVFQPVPGADLGLPRPVWLCIGRLSWEKNLPAFLDLDLPGTKVVYGAGPLAPSLAQRYPDVVWRGVVPRNELAHIYSAADAFVFPGRSETFGLVMLEALACGTPVAAFPVAGPADVLGDSDAGVLSEDLRAAALAALDIAPERALARARTFDWSAVVTQFLGLLVDARGGIVTAPSRVVHKLGS